VLAFVTLTPAILSWVSNGRSWVQKPRAYHLEFAALIGGLVLLGCVTLAASGSSSSPALLYSLVPFLLWSALRFGSMGVSSSVIVVTFLSIWGVIHGRGPFSEVGPFSSVLALQLFLVFAATPFMVLAALVEERKQAEDRLHESEERLHLAIHAGRMYAFEWDAATDVIVRSGECAYILNWIDDPTRDTSRQFAARVHPDDREAYAAPEREPTPRNPTYQTSYRVLRPDGSVIWLEANGHVLFDGDGRIRRIIGMVADVTERKLAEEALRESEERLRLAIHAGRMYAFEWDAATDVIVRSGECAYILNWIDDPTRDTGRQFAARVHPDDREAYVAMETGLTAENSTYQTSYRMLRPDGEVIWLEESGHAFFDGQGRVLRTIGMVSDITERKIAEAALSSVSRKLIEAQEKERTRIARELHDDISQRLALLTIELERLRETSPDLPTEARSRLGEIQKQTAELGSDVQSMSHELHSSKLEYLGIATAMRGFCKEFSEQQKVEIDFRHDDIPSSVPPEVSLCLFRILQEALQNAAKHSGVRHFDVELRCASDAINLSVRDSGSGFDRDDALKTRGLGLISMMERMKLVGGRISIDSQPQRGTAIRASVPLGKSAAANAR
jgi:signal transduction histidine kinase